jgi:actin-related protein 9
MFPGIDEGTWTYTKIREARDGEKEHLLAQEKAAAAAEAEEEEEEEDEEEGEVKEVEMKEGEVKETSATPKKDVEMVDEDVDEEMVDGVYVEDEDDEEGAVWCLKEGRVTDWGCFFALLLVPAPFPTSRPKSGD